MIESLETIDRADVCGTCGTSVEGRRYLLEDGGASLRDYCSEACVRAAQDAQRRRRWKARRRATKVAIIGLAVAGACLAPHEGKHLKVAAPAPPPVAQAAGLTVPPGWFGPE